MYLSSISSYEKLFFFPRIARCLLLLLLLPLLLLRIARLNGLSALLVPIVYTLFHFMNYLHTDTDKEVVRVRDGGVYIVCVYIF